MEVPSPARLRQSRQSVRQERRDLHDVRIQNNVVYSKLAAVPEAESLLDISCNSGCTCSPPAIRTQVSRRASIGGDEVVRDLGLPLEKRRASTALRARPVEAAQEKLSRTAGMIVTSPQLHTPTITSVRIPTKMATWRSSGTYSLEARSSPRPLGPGPVYTGVVQQRCQPAPTRTYHMACTLQPVPVHTM